MQEEMQVKGERFNPFRIYGITDYTQYKDAPFLQTNYVQSIKKVIEGNIRERFHYPDRILLLGNPGTGKTTTLFYIKDLLENGDSKCNIEIFVDKFVVDDEDFYQQKGRRISEVIQFPTYFLIDFPDNFTEKSFREFLKYCSRLMTREGYNNINLVFALNKSHFNRSFKFSEVLNKFERKTSGNLTREETNELIKKRLDLAGLDNLFEDKIYDLIYEYTKGIPRNIICASKTLVDEYFNKSAINYAEAKKLFKNEYIAKILEDRVENQKEKELFEKIVTLLMSDYFDKSINQSDLLDIFKEKIDIGRNKGIYLLNELYKFGLIEYELTGRNNVEKVWLIK
jgi:hypothetical protein